MTAPAAGVHRLCVVGVGELLLGVPVDVVQEVTERLPLTEVPMAPRGVRGVVNLRGHLVTALDLPALLGAAGLPGSAAAPVDVIVRHGGELLGLPVDAISEVLDAPEHARVPPPDNLTGPVRGLVRGVHAVDRGLVLELDVPALVAAARSDTPLPIPVPTPESQP